MDIHKNSRLYKSKGKFFLRAFGYREYEKFLKKVDINKSPWTKLHNLEGNIELLGKEISFEQEVSYKVDKFGRELGYVFIGGVNLNIELVRNGLARVVLYEKRAKIKYQDELLSAEKSAKELRLGVWKK